MGAAASIRLWRDVEMHYLHENMGLECVGAGAGLDESATIGIPQRMIIESLVNEIYPGIDESDQYFLDRSVLGCTNESVIDLN
jgi:hypothetical protein